MCVKKAVLALPRVGTRIPKKLSLNREMKQCLGIPYERVYPSATQTLSHYFFACLSSYSHTVRSQSLFLVRHKSVNYVFHLRLYCCLQLDKGLYMTFKNSEFVSMRLVHLIPFVCFYVKEPVLALPLVGTRIPDPSCTQ